MRIKINDKTYDAEDTLIMIHLSNQDKSNIYNMTEDSCIYAAFPDNHDIEFSELTVFRKEMDALDDKATK